LARRLLLSLVPLLLVVLAADIYVHRREPIGQLIGTRAAIYAVLVLALLVAQRRRHEWLDALDRRFFRERYDTSRILRQVAADIEGASTLEQAAARVAASIHVALHPTFVSVLLKRAGDNEYRRVACVPPGEGPSALPAGGRLVGLATVLGTPLEVADAAAQGDLNPLPSDEAALVAASRLELVVPVPAGPAAAAAVLALGPRRSEEPYASEALALLGSIARGLGFLLDRHTRTGPSLTTFGECPRCGTCYDHGSTLCSKEGATLVPSRLPRVFTGRYRLESRLGQGGMGVVYRAHDEALDRPVAVKVLREELVADPRSAERFQREARLSARFSHPHVVTIHDFGVLGEGRAFLVMELLHGRTLRDELAQRGRLPRGRVLQVLRPVCGAVGSAHRRQLVHRDLKPENVFLAEMDGVETPKVLDFGIAKISGMAAAAGHGETGVGLLLGTPQYMAPEQLRGEEAAPAWDLWSLAIVAYELLTGGYPVPGCRPGQPGRMALPAGDTSRLAGVLEVLGDREHAFFRQALAIDPAGRPATAETFLAGLEVAISGDAT
ncbi:MAG: serine/threonine protein kinase, partial [Acidobacteria bacterium]